MDPSTIGQYLIDNSYHLTALELLTEYYEKNGKPIENLSAFFEESSNFLTFNENSTPVTSESLTNTSVEDAMRIKDDRIAVLEHQVKVLNDQLQDTDKKPEQSQATHEEDTSSQINLQSPSPAIEHTSIQSEDQILSNLVGKYLISKGFRLTALAFNNEKPKESSANGPQIPDDVDLSSLLHSYLFVQKSPEMANEIDELRTERNQSRDQIAQLQLDLDYSNRKLQEITKQLSDLQAEKDRTTKLQSEDQSKAEESTKEVKPKIPSTDNAPPSVELMNSVYETIKPLVKDLDDSKKDPLINPLKLLIRLHPIKSIRIECINLLFSIFSDPSDAQQSQIIESLKESCQDQTKVEGEILPIVTQLMASTVPSICRLVLKAIGEFAELCSVDLRYTLLFSIVKQMADSGNYAVKAEAGKCGAKLIRTFGDSADAKDKLGDILYMSKQLAFDSDVDVQDSALKFFIPALVDFATLHKCVGSSVMQFWFKEATNFALTGSSQIATIRFQLSSKVISMLFEIFAQNKENSDNHEEESWIAENIGPQLVKISPALFVQIPIKKHVDFMTSSICSSLGSTFVSAHVLPAFQEALSKDMGELRKQIMASYISGVAPEISEEQFLKDVTFYIEASSSDHDGFTSNDVTNYIAFAITLICGRSSNDGINNKKLYVFKLLNNLSTSQKSTMRSSAVTIINEFLQTIDQETIESKILPIINKLAFDPDEEIQLQTISCVGEILRFSTLNNVIKAAKQLFDDWFKRRPAVRLQCLRSFSAICNDVDQQFRDTYLMPKLLDVAKDNDGLGDSKDQAYILILSILHSVKELSDNIVKDLVVPTMMIISESPVISSDPMMKELKETYKVNSPKDGIAKFFVVTA